MKNLVLVGAGGLGREMLEWVRQCPQHGVEWRVKGFIDDRLDALDPYPGRGSVFATFDGYRPEADDLVVCCVGNPVIKRRLVESLLSKGAEFATIIHPTAIVGSGVRVGRGVIVCPRATITCDVSLGDFVTVNCSAGIGHDAVIRDFGTVSSFCDITGHVELGEGAFVGSHASVLPGIKVGAGATVCAGSAAYSNVAPQATVMGVPARKIAGLAK